MDWATVCLIVIIDVDTRAIHRSCLRHRSIYSTMAGKLCAKCSAAKPHGQFKSKRAEGKDRYQKILMYEGFPDKP